MALADSPISVSGPMKRRLGLLRFWGRVVLAVGIASASLHLIQHPAERLTDEKLLEDPLTMALHDLGVSVLESEILVVAPVEQGVAPTLSQLKETARAVARAMPGYDPERFWTESGEAYRVVYFEGAEPTGGRWVASARYLPRSSVADGNLGMGVGAGSVEVTVFRSFLGVPRQIGQLARSTQALMARAVGRPLRASEAAVRLRGRPPYDASREDVAREILSRLGADLRYESADATEYVAAGLSTRLLGRTQLGRHTVNVVISVSQRGMGPWVEVESSALK